MAETKQDDVDAMLTRDLIEAAQKLQDAARVRVPPDAAELMEDAARLMSRAEERIQALKGR